MLNDTRFAAHFEFMGNWDVHYGIYPDCGVPLPFGSGERRTQQGTRRGPAANHRGPDVLLEVVPITCISL